MGASAPAHILVVFITITGAMGLRMCRVNRLDRACAVFYPYLSDISVAVRQWTGSRSSLPKKIKMNELVYLYASSLFITKM